jgi:hypothetical protein
VHIHFARAVAYWTEQYLTKFFSFASIFVAFIVEVFMKQYEVSRREYKSKLEKAIRRKGVGIGR